VIVVGPLKKKKKKKYKPEKMRLATPARFLVGHFVGSDLKANITVGVALPADRAGARTTSENGHNNYGRIGFVHR
jgi:hypothetical protein